MSTKAMVAYDIPEWHGRATSIVRFFFPHAFANKPIMQVNATYLDVNGATKLRDLCNEFLADAAQETSE